MPQGLKHDVDLDTLPNAKVVTNGKQGKPFLIQNQVSYFITLLRSLRRQEQEDLFEN